MTNVKMKCRPSFGISIARETGQMATIISLKILFKKFRFHDHGDTYVHYGTGLYDKSPTKYRAKVLYIQIIFYIILKYLLILVMIRILNIFLQRN